ncbi:DUF6702 family protein [Flavobacterium sp.]|uniref:DUF6702 family protein n=1 Tax=Flavobacterium sp. TaxID=239 RepID=UPI003D0C23F7
MKKALLYIILVLTMASFALHKFYVSIYQINYAEDKKMLQITSRIFVDDINKVLSDKYKTKVNFGEPAESVQDLELLKKYAAERFLFKVNGKIKPIRLATKEIEGNVLVCYYSIKDISKIKQLEIENSMLLELNDEQQNIMHTQVKGIKKSFLFSGTNFKAMLKY